MKTLYLNLDSRPDRREQVEAEFKRVGFYDVERIPAESGDNPMLAFNKSVYKAIQYAWDNPENNPDTRPGTPKSLLLFEDDVVFAYESPVTTTVFWRAVHDLPKDAMTLHLGCNFMAQWEMPKTFNTRISLLPNCWQSHATYYSEECVRFILDNMRTDIMTEEHCIFDEWLRKNVLSQGRSYVMRPMIARQRPSKSDIWNCQADYTSCYMDGNKWLIENT